MLINSPPLTADDLLLILANPVFLLSIADTKSFLAVLLPPSAVTSSLITPFSSPSWCERLARTHYLIYINFQNGMVIITIISCTAKFPTYWVGHKA